MATHYRHRPSMAGFVIIAVTFVLLYAGFILPQQRRMRAHQALVAALEVGDEVMTTSGLVGTIVGLDDDEARLEIAEGVVVRFARAAVARRLGPERPEDDPASPAPSPAAARPAGTAADRAPDRPDPSTAGEDS